MLSSPAARSPLRFRGRSPNRRPLVAVSKPTRLRHRKLLVLRGFPGLYHVVRNEHPEPPEAPPTDGKGNREPDEDPPVPIRFAPLRPWSSPIRAGTFPPVSVSVCVSVCSQPPGGSIPPILRADCLTRRGQAPLPKTLSPPTHSLFFLPAGPLRDRRLPQTPPDFPCTGPRTLVRSSYQCQSAASEPISDFKRTEVRGPVAVPGPPAAPTHGRNTKLRSVVATSSSTRIRRGLSLPVQLSRNRNSFRPAW